MKKTVKYSLGGIILFLAFFLSACHQKKNDTWNRVEQSKRIIIGLDDSFVPMGFVRKNGQLTGYDIDLAKAVFKLYKIKPDFQTIDWSMNNLELRNKTIDLIWNGYSITKPRAKKVDFSVPYLKNEQVIVVKKRSGINKLRQFKNKNLGMQTGSTAEQWYESGQKTLKAKQQLLYDQVPSAFLDLNAGRIQGILLDDVYANYYLKHLKNSQDYRIIKSSKMPADYFAVGMRKGDRTLQEKINRGLQRLQKNGELAKINQKWFDKKSNYLGK